MAKFNKLLGSRNIYKVENEGKSYSKDNVSALFNKIITKTRGILRPCHIFKNCIQPFKNFIIQSKFVFQLIRKPFFAKNVSMNDSYFIRNFMNDHSSVAPGKLRDLLFTADIHYQRWLPEQELPLATIPPSLIISTHS